MIDDDPEVHDCIRGALGGLTLFDGPLELLHCTHGDDTRARLLGEHDLAMVIVDLVSQDASGGLVLLDFIRRAAGLRSTRIVLRTGAPHGAPDLDTLLRYDISDYHTKSDLTPDRWQAISARSLQGFQRLRAFEASRRSMETIMCSSAALLEETDLHAFATGVITQLAALLGVAGEGLVCVQDTTAVLYGNYRVRAATGRFAGLLDLPMGALPASGMLRLLHRALSARGNVLGNQPLPSAAPSVQPPPRCCGDNVFGDDRALALYMGRTDDQDMVVYIELEGSPIAPDRQLLDFFCAGFSTLLRNRGLLERLRRSAYSDPLVSLPNRAYFIEKVGECVQRGMDGLMLALVDIDDFSATNEMMGHRFGDRLLDAVAQRLAEILPAGVMLARVGSDTFGVLGSAHKVSPQQLLDCVHDPLTINGMPHQVSMTCGYVLLPEDARTGDDLVKDATIALKRAKRDHRGQQLQYAVHMGTEARDRAVLLSNLRAAIESAELFLVYQPQVHLETGDLIGLEALLRWRTADGRLVPPDQFIPVAEHSGLILPLGQWALQMACQTLRELQTAGLAPQRMAVNVSVVQLRDPGFFGMVCAALSDNGLAGHHLELEVTESVVVLPTQLLQSTLNTLRAQGVTIAIDDFGTGYSSLSYLEQLPLDRIKIDRTFVQQLDAPQGGRVAEMVVQLGRKLGLQVLAEGIENAAAWQALQAMGCQGGQGYHIAHPMEKAALLLWLAQA
ncbi:MAG: EAL domain-containing protein [Acidovorax sp.]